jgi:tRNA1Val (adenine37-N6)-methyltransferase
MGRSVFRFQQFQVSQECCAMKVGTDGILLGAWAPALSPGQILDIGTGTGLLALMMAQRFPNAQIDAIEVEKDAWEQAKENCRQSPWSDRLTVFGEPLQSYETEQSYDFLICNPPFFHQGLRSPDPARKQARHGDSLSYPDLAFHSHRLSHAQSQMALVIPAEYFAVLDVAMEQANWHLRQQVGVQALPSKRAHRYLLLYSRQPGRLHRDQFCIAQEPGRHSAFFLALTDDYYLPGRLA